MRWCGLFVVVLQLVGCGEGEGAITPDDLLQAGLSAPHAPCTVERVTVRDFGRVVYLGDMDLLGEVTRILHGEHLPFKHDGTVFRNREHRLPQHNAGYYHEFVHPTPGIAGPGPQRIVLGEARELEYTADHYESFVLLPDTCLAQAGG